MSSALLQWLHSFRPAPSGAGAGERVRACLGALFGIAVTGAISHALLGDSHATLWLVAPMGASAVLAFAVPASPLAQPWSIVGGNVVAAVIGVSCAKLIPVPVLAAALGVCLAIGAGFALRCLHPPSGAVALTAVLGGPAIQAAGYELVFAPIALNSLLLAGAALIYNNATGRRYPHAQKSERRNEHGTRDLPPTARLGFSEQDLDAVLQRYNQVLDVSRDDLEDLITQTEMQAYSRHLGDIRCSAIMSRDVVSAVFATELEEAWQLMRRHQIKALPVLDRARRVIGVVTQADFLRSADLERYDSIATTLRKFLQRTPSTHTDKPEVVGVIMTPKVKTVHVDTPIVHLVPLMADSGLHHIPVVDDERRLAGMVTQSDLVAALYARGAQGQPA